jgi:hypothetical protein
MGRHRPNGWALGSLGHISGMLALSPSPVPPNLVQFYFFTVISGYGVGQRGDHEKYNSMYSMTGLNSDPALPSRSDPWDSRVGPTPGGEHHGHERHESTTSDTVMLDNPYSDPPPLPVTIPVPTVTSTGHLNQSKPSQYDSYDDSYYNRAQR